MTNDQWLELSVLSEQAEREAAKVGGLHGFRFLINKATEMLYEVGNPNFSVEAESLILKLREALKPTHQPAQQPMKPHYYVMRVGSEDAPKFKHKTIESARGEAERLATQHPRESFEILQCLGVSSTVKATTFWCDGCGTF